MLVCLLDVPKSSRTLLWGQGDTNEKAAPTQCEHRYKASKIVFLLNQSLRIPPPARLPRLFAVNQRGLHGVCRGYM